MSKKMDIWETLKQLDNAGFKIGSLLAGFLGALASLIWDQEKMSWQRAIGIVLMGSVAAGYLTPIIVHYVGIPDFLENSVSFLVGLMVMRISDKSLDFIKQTDLETLIRIITKRK